MPVTVTIDDEPLAAGRMGMETLGHVLSHIQRDKRLVIQILIDGNEPQLGEMGTLRSTKLEGHCVYIETAEPSKLVETVLSEVEHLLQSADEARERCIGFLRQNLLQKAMEQLGFCFRSWQDVQSSVSKVFELIRMDMDQVFDGEGKPLTDRLDVFSAQLRRIKGCLEKRDYISLCDLLAYEMNQATDNWKTIIQVVRGTVLAGR